MKNYLVMFDISGIQDFIFSTPKLKEIIGASFLVEEVLNRILNDTIIEFDKSFRLNKIYSGGGTALFDLSIENQESFIEFDKSFKKKVLLETGKLTVVSAIVPYEEGASYSEILSSLRQNLALKKRNSIRHSFFENETVMKTLPGTGAGIIKEHKASNVNHMKLQAFEREVAGHKKELKNISDFVSEFDQFVDKNEDSYIGIVHIDGNDMGMTIKELLDKTCVMTMEEALSYHREISEAIDEKFFNAALEGVNIFNGSNGKVKIRPIVLAGDDITFVCAAKDALDLSRHILNEIKKIDLMDYKFNACAGIAMVKSHYPIDIAYQLSESLCKEAKNVFKKKNLKGSAINYHYHFNGLEHDIEKIRLREYPDYCKPCPINLESGAALSGTIDYELLSRFVKDLKINGFTISKLKQVRKHLFISITEANLYIEREIKKLILSDETLKILRNIEDNGSLLIAAIELYDYLKKGAENAN